MNTPTDWDGPVFLMNFPLSVSNKVANNALMCPELQGIYDKVKAGKQWLTLYKTLTEKSLIYILPGHDNFQDLPFVANLGCYLPHISYPTILLSNFTSKPRQGEELIGSKFFSSFDYVVERSPYSWEGEADLKWLYDNVYVGGVGIRSTYRAYSWMQQTFDMTVINIEMLDQKLYHLDCVFFPLTATKALVNTSAISFSDIKRLENFIEIIEIPEEHAYKGWTNCIRLGNSILHATNDESWRPFESLLSRHGFELETFDLSEFDKSGADLSCLCMHLNMKNRNV